MGGMMLPMLRVFCDFDGTLTTEDVGNRLFRTFAGNQAETIVEDYLLGHINARECLRLECEALGIFKEEEVRSFIDQFQLDSHALDFVGFCRKNGVPLTILSDGLDFYVESVLTRFGLNDIPWYANHALFRKSDGGVEIVPSFPYRDEHCDLCGNCKRNHIVTQSGENDIVVYVGDGISDRCPVRFADVVFAKSGLIRYCQEQNISYYEFRHLGDVRERLEQIIKGKKAKQRREAVVARRDVFMAE